MFRIEVEDVYEGFHTPGEEVPRIVAVGETEFEAVEIYTIFFNHFLLCAPGEKFTNVSGRTVHTTYASGFENFVQLKRYFEEVNGTILKITQED